MPMRVIRTSQATGVTHEREMNVTQEQLDEWRLGLPIQTAMPHLSRADREFIVAGITPEEARQQLGLPEPTHGPERDYDGPDFG